MEPKERVLAMLDFQVPDVVPLEYHPSAAGLFEHGRRLADLWARYPQDFGDLAGMPIPSPGPECFDADGSYHELRRDEWGVLWDHRIFGVAGHPVERPLDDWSNLAAFRAPDLPDGAPGPLPESPFFRKVGWFTIFETMIAVRRFEDVLVDVQVGAPEAHRLADIITDHRVREIERAVAQGADALQFADDFGTATGLLMSARTWRGFFRPRYERMVTAAKRGGARVFFHSCGRMGELLEDLAELGVDAVWPQLSVYDERELAARCRDLGLAVALHPDRGDLMTRGTPGEVRAAVARLAETFAVDRGGAWLYVEIDHGFPFENVEALVEAVALLRA